MITFDKFMQIKGYSPTTKYLYKLYLSKLKEPITKDSILNFISQYNHQVSRAFIKVYITEYLHKKLNLPKMTGAKGSSLTNNLSLSIDEYKKLMNAISNDKLRLGCKLMMEGGMRHHEVSHFKVKNVLTDKAGIKVSKEYSKRKKEYIAPLSQNTYQELLRYIQHHKLGQEDRVIVLSRSRFNTLLAQKSIEVLGKRVSTHWFKRTLGRWLEAEGYELLQINNRLHHDPKNTASTIRYLHKRGDCENEYREDLENLY